VVCHVSRAQIRYSLARTCVAFVTFTPRSRSRVPRSVAHRPSLSLHPQNLRMQPLQQHPKCRLPRQTQRQAHRQAQNHRPSLPHPLPPPPNRVPPPPTRRPTKGPLHHLEDVGTIRIAPKVPAANTKTHLGRSPNASILETPFVRQNPTRVIHKMTTAPVAPMARASIPKPPSAGNACPAPCAESSIEATTSRSSSLMHAASSEPL
jgi:hypothetical protein